MSKNYYHYVLLQSTRIRDRFCVCIIGCVGGVRTSRSDKGAPVVMLFLVDKFVQ